MKSQVPTGIFVPKAQCDIAQKARAKARRQGKEVHVGEFYRHFPAYVSDPKARRAIKWVELELAAVRLCSDIDRHGVMPGDRVTAKQLINFVTNLIEDTLSGK